MSGTILVADGTAASRITLKAKLASACYATGLARDVEDAVAVARITAPDAIVASDALPGGGIAALSAALDADPGLRGTPLVAICDAAGRLAAIREGADAVLERPLDEFMLLARLRSLLARRGPRGLAEGRDAARCSLSEAPAAWEDTGDDIQPAGQGAARLVLVAPDAVTAMGWRRAFPADAGFDTVSSTAAQALAAAAAGCGADLYLIAADLAHPGDGLRLLSELRARPASRGAGFVIALDPAQRALAPVALDLGAGDVLPLSLADRGTAEEAALRLTAQLAAKRRADRRRQEAEAERRWALTDPLTGLANRRHAVPRLTEMAAAGTGLAVMLLDLDRFKAINDSRGHAAGDAVLAEVAERLRETMPATALLARIGGEEFLAAAPAANARAAAALAEALRATLAARPVPLAPDLGGGEVAVTASVGLAFAPPGSRSAAERLMRTADRALLTAKAAGRNRVIEGVAEQAA